MRVLGIDACRIGWVAAVLDDGQATTFRLATTLAGSSTEPPAPTRGRS